jgi:hypothetical protein
MISSEVQRTLVKSPPELWSELSDPDALARHLGELGEIKITRVEPENLVEWEAEGTTGTVEIRPSGWGTRVTLTVSREQPADTGAAPDASGDPAGDPPQADDDRETESAPRAFVREEDGGEAEPEASDLDPAPEGAPAQHPPVAEPEDLAPARKPAPATEAARRAAGWPSAGALPGPAIESDLRAAEALGGPPTAPAGVQEWAAQAIEEPEAIDAGEPAAITQGPLPERKLGFFARLFGRRRRAAAPQASPVADDLEAEIAAEPAEAEAPQEPAPEEVEDVGAEGAVQTGPEDPAPEDPVAEMEPVAQAEADLPPATAEDETALDPEPEPEPEVHAMAEEPQSESHAAEPGLASELRAAEEVAAEQVEAVLSAVLDRLGAAHHRPFSRP